MFSLLLVWLLGLCSPTWAHKVQPRQRYEQALLRWALKHTKLQRDPQPAGKVITRVVLLRADVIAPIDPWPKWINLFHATTRSVLVRRELLLKEGDRWQPKLIDETERNLRALGIFSTARALPCKAKQPDQVILLVITKDLWSLRISTEFRFSGGILQALGFYPNEMNLAGLGKQLGIYLSLNQLDIAAFTIRDQISLGQFYYDPRLFGSRFRLYEEFALYLDGDLPCAGAIGKRFEVWCPQTSPGTPNGLFARLYLDRPLFALATRWSFYLNAQVKLRQSRSFRTNPQQGSVPPGERPGLSVRTVQLTGLDGILYAIPRVTDTREFKLTASLTYSMGWRFKHDLTIASGLFWFGYQVPAGFPFPADIQQKYVALSLPRSEGAVFVALRYRLRPTHFLRLRNVALFALTEDFVLGPSVQLELRPSIDLLNPTQQYVYLYSSVGYTWGIGKDLLTLSGTCETRWQPHSYQIGIRGPWLNNTCSIGAYNISPRLWIGRIFARVSLTMRDNNIDNETSSIGTNHGVRGVLDGQYAGQHKFLVNVEYRTLPLNLWTLHVGLVLFYDGGAVWGGRDPNRPEQSLPFIYQHSLGLGLRMLFPQFSRSIIRIDMGVPLLPNPGNPLSWFIITYNQAF